MRTLLASLLIFSLVSPVNAGAAAWMAMSMDASAQHDLAASVMHHAAESVMDMANNKNMDKPQPHEHDSSDCEEHCASCTNHCSSTAIVTSQVHAFDRDQHSARFLIGVTLHHHDTPFRPPIHA